MIKPAFKEKILALMGIHEITEENPMDPDAIILAQTEHLTFYAKARPRHRIKKQLKTRRSLIARN